jgi:hypothetical protein
MKLVASVIVGLGVAVIIAGLIIGWFYVWNFEKQADDFNELFFETGNKTYINKITAEQFVFTMRDYWMSCDRFNATPRSAYVTGTAKLNKEYIFGIIKNLSWCDSIQSKDKGCGVREDTIIPEIQLPMVIRMNCTNDTLVLSQ